MYRDEESMFKEQAYRYFLFGIFAIAVSFFLSDLILREITKHAGLSGDLREILGEAFRLVILMVIIFAGHMQRRILASDRESFAHGLLTGLPILAIAAAQLVLSIIQADPGYFAHTELVASTLVIYTLTGIFEELLFRGVVLNAFQDAFAKKSAKTIWVSLFLSALAFGMMHFTNLASGQDVVGTLMQVIEATAVGDVLRRRLSQMPQYLGGGDFARADRFVPRYWHQCAIHRRRAKCGRQCRDVHPQYSAVPRHISRAYLVHFKKNQDGSAC